AQVGWLRRAMTPLRDPQTWLDIIWSIVNLVTATVAFCVAVTWWCITLAGLSYGLWQWALPADDGSGQNLPDVLGLHGMWAAVSAYFVIGLVGAVTLPFVMRLVALMHGGLAKLLLSSRAEMQAEVGSLKVSKEAARDAEQTALRRLERDIHDGPQQRLVRLTMDISRAKRQVETDPDRATSTLDGALENARATVDELRAVSRGIAPPVLADRGLAAALDEVLSRSEVPVDSTVQLPEEELPALVESTIYFVVSEGLTNVTKHSQASECRVGVVPSAHGGPALMDVRITDNGVGGAEAVPGHGLAGLADRVRAADGTWALTSPSGGPTDVHVELPCG
ncbi:MAG: sensor histidine kinase, partial [Nocardioidaceae bacterium]